MPETFDVVVIGSGSAAGQIAFTCRSAGRSVAIIDSKPFGGTCQLRGCDPKKVLVGAADLVDWHQRMSTHGITGEAHIDWPALMNFKRSFTDHVPAAHKKNYAESGIVAIEGRARFLSPDTLTVNGRELKATNFGIAAGMAPAPLHIPGEDLLIDSEQFLNLDSLPARLIFVGGGYIAFEFAHLCARAGVHVTIINSGHPLQGFDPDLVTRLVEKSKALGIQFEFGSKVSSVEKTQDGFLVRAEQITHVTDMVVHAAGRVPDLSDMDLHAASVQRTAKGITVDPFLNSPSNPRVYAAGDCADTGNPALTPVAGWEGRTAAANILQPGSTPMTPHVIPSVVFTIPPLARVGISEAEASGKEYVCNLSDTSGWYSSRRVAEDTGLTKTIIEKDTGKLLGAHVLGHQAEELINIFALAIRCGLTVNDLNEQIFAYPSHGSDIRYMI